MMTEYRQDQWQLATTLGRPPTHVRYNCMADLLRVGEEIELISTDVFDTLLLRRFRSERSRVIEGERLFSNLLAKLGKNIDPDFLVEARLQSQRLAFRSMNLSGSGREVSLLDIISRQLGVLGLPSSLVVERLRIEVQVEKRSLFANRELADVLRELRRAGARIVALSDTTLPAEAVNELIRHFHGPELVERVYSSADQGATKRDGSLFLAVAKRENVPLHKILHIGDDLLADVTTPSNLGVVVRHVPRPSYGRHIRSANGALAELGRRLRRDARATKTISRHDDAVSFGRDVFGPIVTQFCLMIWLYVAEAEKGDDPCLLFCARGGVGIREAFEHTLARFRLPLKVRRENIMISRLVVARAALLARSPSAIEELNREFRGSALADVASAIGGRPYVLSDDWGEPFDAEKFVSLVFSSSGVEVLADIEEQNTLFSRYFKNLIGSSRRIILCDTGLYGSTQRLLASAFPQLHIETIQFARANYKGHSDEHFPKVVGVMVEQNVYSPLSINSCVLRYWQLVESLFEPPVASVRLFSKDDRGVIQANCGAVSFGAIDPSKNNPLLFGALSYIKILPVDGGAVVFRDVEAAWRRLKSAIIRPTEADLRCLAVGGRSVDFGRPEVLQIFTRERKKKTFVSKLLSLQAQLWREGAITREFPLLKHALLPTLEMAHCLRRTLSQKR
jgi:FMN phosphatase YigB (HAD superfamily)